MSNANKIREWSFDPRDIEDLERVMGLITTEGAKLNPETPGRPRPSALPLTFRDTSLDEWLTRVEARKLARLLVTSHCNGLIGVEPSQVGLYFYCEMIATCGDGPEDLLSDVYGGAQHLKVKTGISDPCTRRGRHATVFIIDYRNFLYHQLHARIAASRLRLR